MSNITLTASMRTNLLSLQNTQSLMDTTQERLSTGLKVNSAIDNPSAYYTAQSLSNRANDLSSLLDSMGQGIQTIQAANEGIEAMTAFLEQAKAIVSSAADATDAAEVGNYADQFDEIMEQIQAVAKDASYKGVNLLKGETLTVKFNEKTGADVSSIDITGTDFTTLTNFHEKLAVAGENWVKDGAPDKAKIGEYMDAVSGAITKLRETASELGNNYSIVENRQDFTENLINVLTEGADKLTLADMNEESANMLALQTRQQLAINSLSLASQAAQSVLKLF